MTRLIITMALFAISCMPVSAAEKIHPFYVCTGQYLDGISYSAVLQVEDASPTFRFHWFMADTVYIGLGVRDGDRIAVGFGDAFTGGVGGMLMEVKKDRIESKYVAGPGKVATESCKREDKPTFPEMPKQPDVDGGVGVGGGIQL